METKGCQAYVKHMEMHGHPGLQMTRSGLAVEGWLGASPDGWVTDPSAINVHGILELKCPYSKADVSPEKACEDDNFSCSMVNSKLMLKRNHAYYHQVQLQLYVAADLCDWCDFCVYTTCGVAVERIYPDIIWQNTCCLELDSYSLNHVLPELVYPCNKPSYYL